MRTDTEDGSRQSIQGSLIFPCLFLLIFQLINIELFQVSVFALFLFLFIHIGVLTSIFAWNTNYKAGWRLLHQFLLSRPLLLMPDLYMQLRHYLESLMAQSWGPSLSHTPQPINGTLPTTILVGAPPSLPAGLPTLLLLFLFYLIIYSPCTSRVFLSPSKSDNTTPLLRTCGHLPISPWSWLKPHSLAWTFPEPHM